MFIAYLFSRVTNYTWPSFSTLDSHITFATRNAFFANSSRFSIRALMKHNICMVLLLLEDNNKATEYDTTERQHNFVI